MCVCCCCCVARVQEESVRRVASFFFPLKKNACHCGLCVCGGKMKKRGTPSECVLAGVVL